MTQKKSLISVIVPVYNVEKYIAQTLDSVIAQSVGFKENIELIIINDGSTDNSEAVCLEYTQAYPENITYVKQKNQGVSVARRTGFSRATSEYVHFLDSDDIISKDFYAEILGFFAKHDEVDLVAAKIKFIEGRTGAHYLNKRFVTSRVIDTKKEPTAIQNNITTAVIRRAAINKSWFDKKLSIGEDSLIAALVVGRKERYGVVCGPTYYYRVRQAGGSAINTQHQNRSYYIDTPVRYWNRALDAWQDDTGSIASYAQYLVFNDIHWRINEQKSQNVLDQKEEERYKKVVYETVSRIDDSIIMQETRLSLEKRIHLLKRKYGKDFDKHIHFDGERYRINNVEICDEQTYAKHCAVFVDFIVARGNNKYFIEGFSANDPIYSGDQIVIKTSRGEFPVRFVERAQRGKDGFLGDSFCVKEAFEVTVETGTDDYIRAYIKTHAGDTIDISITPQRHTRIGAIRGSYRKIGQSIFVKNKRSLKLVDPLRFHAFRQEIKLLFGVAANLRMGETVNLTLDALRHIKAILKRNVSPGRSTVVKILMPFGFFARTVILNTQNIFIRFMYKTTNFGSSKKPIWIISDRGTAAGDNGEAFFRYLIGKKESSYDYYFAISRNSADYKRLKRTGRVIDNKGLRYKILFLRSSKIISSHADSYVDNPFGVREQQLIDLYNFEYVFLQHGIIKDDMSDWLNRFNKNFSIFVTSSKYERDSILACNYYYKESNVLLSGLPRYDLLENQPKGKLIIAPTWRQNLLQESRGNQGGVREYSSAFVDTEYYKFYNSLINDNRIKKALKSHGMTGELYIHPAFMRQKDDFIANEQITVADYPYDYRTAFRDGDLLVTDYSSVAFDFAYLGKPVVYTQFDKDSLYESHIYTKGYFSYEEHGLGPVLYDYESTISAIVNCIKEKCAMKDEFTVRADDFFAYRDRNNSQRVYEAVVQIEPIG